MIKNLLLSVLSFFYASVSLAGIYGHLPALVTPPSEATTCKSYAPTVQGIKDYLSLDRDIVRVRELRGLNLKNQSKRQVKALKTLLKKDGDLLSFAKKTKFPRATDLRCETVQCVVTSIWGEEIGLKILYIKLKFNFLISEYAVNSVRQFRLAEIDSIIAVLEDLPAHIITGINKYDAISPKMSIAHLGSDIAGEAQGVAIRYAYYNLETNFFNFSFQSTVIHEVGHLVSFSQKKESHWREMFKDSECFLSQYSTSKEYEDFAEHFSAYRYHADEFKFQCPLKYDAMKTVFKGVEYTGSSFCHK